MNKLLEIGLVTVAISAVAVGDVLAKKAASHANTFWDALKSPLVLVVAGLYVLQIAIFLYVFVKKAELGVVGLLQTALYVVIVVGSGVLFFNEHITPRQIMGLLLALLAIVLINW